jgi:hypothetical protein
MKTTPIVVERAGRGVHRLHQGRFLLASVRRNLASAGALGASLARVLGVELYYRAKPGAAPVVLVGR